MKAAAILLSLLPLAAPAQSRQTAPAPPPVYGSVTGHITCVDTNQPARLASVALQSIDVKPQPTEAPGTPLLHEPMTRTYQTSLDGSYTIPKVPPGTYYLVIDAPGYLSPIKQFSRAELEKPTTESLARILKAVPTVTVEANHTSTLDTRIERGGELSGTVRYDDGTPVGNINVSVLLHEHSGGKDTWVGHGNYAQTDDIGHFRITGLAAGEHLLQVTLALRNTYVSSVLNDSHRMMMMTGYSLSFFSGDVARKDKAKPIKLEAGEQRDGADITIPVSKLHSVSGTLTVGATGHVVNAGNIALKFSDGTELTTTKVDADDSLFHFDFVPEGEYTLNVTDARDVRREELPPTPGVTPMPGMTKDTLLREYGPATTPLIVQTDITGLTIPVPPKPAATTATQ